MSESDLIYNMSLHEMKQIGDPRYPLATTVFRVPGGWVYSLYDKSNDMMSSVFVSWDNEFQGQK